jgi:hypothetical protein
MREDAAEQYLTYKLIDSNQDWKSKWFYITNRRWHCRHLGRVHRLLPEYGWG